MVTKAEKINMSSSTEISNGKASADKLAHLMDQLSSLSEIERLYVSLKLASSQEPIKSSPQPSSSSRSTTLTWIRTHYVEDKDVCVPKQDVYNQYRLYCEASGLTPKVSAADFGKMMKTVFPNIHHRRLGQRGKSRYCYGGVKRKSQVELPLLPSLVPQPKEEENAEHGQEQSPLVKEDIYALSSQVICEWAGALLDKNFTCMISLAQYLVDIGAVCGRNARTFPLVYNDFVPAPQHHDTHAKLQRKLQQKEVLKEHRQKLKQQQQKQKELHAAKLASRATITPSCSPYSNTKAASSRPSSSKSLEIPFEPRSTPDSSVREKIDSVSCSSMIVKLGGEVAKQTLNSDHGCSTGTTGESGDLKNAGKESCGKGRSSAECDPGVRKKEISFETDSKVKLITVDNSDISKGRISNCDKADLIHIEGNNSVVGSDLHSITIISSPVCNSEASKHNKRNGDCLSLDARVDSKRRCTTSLGMAEEHEGSCVGENQEDRNEAFTQLRPLSCPVLCQHKLLSNETQPSKPTLSPSSQKRKTHNRDAQEVSMNPDVNKNVSGSKTEKDNSCQINSASQSPKQQNSFHFVQKPTVVSMSHSNLSMAFQNQSQSTEAEKDPCQATAIPGKGPYKILNSLLSSDVEMLPESAPTKTSSDSQNCLSSLLLSSSSSSLPVLDDKEDVVMHKDVGLIRHKTGQSHTLDNAYLIPSNCVRSAFVPVSSNKSQSLLALDCKEDSKFRNNSVAAFSLAEGGKSNMIGEGKYLQGENETQSAKIPPENFDSAKKKVTSNNSNESTTHESASQKICGSLETTSSLVDSESVFHAKRVPVNCSLDACDVKINTKNVTRPLPKDKQVAVEKLPSTSMTSDSSPTNKANSITLPALNKQVSSSSPTVAPQTEATMTTAGMAKQSSPAACALTPPKKSRFAPIRPKIGQSPQKKETRPVSALVKEKRVRNAQELLVNLANSYQGEVKLQMPAELLGLSPPRKAKSSDVLVTIGTQNGLNRKTPDGQGLRNTSPSQPHKEIMVVVEPVSVNSTASTPSIPKLSPSFYSPSLAKHSSSFTANTGSKSSPLVHSPSKMFTQISTTSPIHHLQWGIESASSRGIINPNTNVIILPPNISATEVNPHGKENADSTVIIADDKGIIYNIDNYVKHGMLTSALPQISPKPSPSLNLKTQSTLDAAGNVQHLREITGHVVGPDAFGQSYLLVPNSGPDVSTVSHLSSLLNNSSINTTTIIPSSSIVTSTPSTVVTTSSSGLISLAHQKPLAKSMSGSSSSAALLTELSQMVSAGKQDRGQAPILHDSASSAFHKCSPNKPPHSVVNLSSLFLTATSSNTGENLSNSGVQLQQNISTEGNLTNIPPTAKAGMSLNPRVENNPPTETENIAEDLDINPSHGQTARKRKASKGSEEGLEEKKRLSDSISTQNQSQKEPDVFIIDMEKDNPSSLDMSKALGNIKTQHVLESEEVEKKSKDIASKVRQMVIKHSQNDSTGCDQILRDPKSLLDMVQRSKSMTVKQVVMAMNSIKAQMNCDKRINRPEKSPTIAEGKSKNGAGHFSDKLSGQRRSRSATTVKAGDALQLNVGNGVTEGVTPSKSSSKHLSQQAISQAKSQKSHNAKGSQRQLRTNKKNVSLNLESLESDALLDTEVPLDHQLVGDISGTFQSKPDQKTSVGVAAKSYRSDKSDIRYSKSRLQKSGILSLHQNDVDQRMGSPSEKRWIQCEGAKKVNRATATQSRDTVSASDVLKCDGRLSVSPVPRRSMSCVWEILQSDSQKLGFLDGSSSQLSKSSISNCISSHNVPSMARSTNMKFDAFETHSEKAESAGAQENNFRKTKLTEPDLPGDIVDFITESMPQGLPFKTGFVSLGDNNSSASQSSAEIAAIRRSLSVPNILPDYLNLTVQDSYECTTSYSNLHNMQHFDGSENYGMKNSIADVNEGFDRDSAQNWHGKVKTKYSVNLSEQPSANDGATGGESSNSVFLSPLGPAKLARRSSVERSLSQTPVDRTHTKTPVEFLTFKSQTDFSSGNKRRNSLDSKAPVDRRLVRTPVDMGKYNTVDVVLTKTPQDSSQEKQASKKENHGGTDIDAGKIPINRSLTKTPIDRHFSKMLNKTHAEMLSQQLSREVTLASEKREDRSSSQTPVSDAGYGSVSETPVSEYCFNSVSPSPVMMTSAAFLSECGRRDMISPATIFMPLRSDSALSVATNLNTESAPISQGHSDFLLDAQEGSEIGSEKNCHTDEGRQSDSLACDSTYGSPLSFPVQHSMDKASPLSSAFNQQQIESKSSIDNIKDLTRDLLDFEKLISSSLYNIPTPPFSPSLTPPIVSTQANFSSSFPFCTSASPSINRSGITSSPSTVAGFLLPGSPTGSSASHVGRYITPMSPLSRGRQDQSSPAIMSSYVTSHHNTVRPSSSPHQSYPHPSPPFTPSSQRSAPSPRCPTPSSHLSVISPRSSTPIDMVHAPHRFMPIQSSCVLATSHAPSHSYIQPIKPVVTLASATNPVASDAHLPILSAATPGCLPTSLGQKSPSSSNYGFQTVVCSANSVFVQACANVSTAANLPLPLKTNCPPLSLQLFESTSHRQGFSVISKKKENTLSEERVSQDQSGSVVISLSGNIGSVSSKSIKQILQGDKSEISKQNDCNKKGAGNSAKVILSTPVNTARQEPSELVHSRTEQLNLNHLPEPNQQATDILPLYEEAVSLLSSIGTTVAKERTKNQNSMSTLQVCESSQSSMAVRKVPEKQSRPASRLSAATEPASDLKLENPHCPNMYKHVGFGSITKPTDCTLSVQEQVKRVPGTGPLSEPSTKQNDGINMYDLVSFSKADQPIPESSSHLHLPFDELQVYPSSDFAVCSVPASYQNQSSTNQAISNNSNLPLNIPARDPRSSDLFCSKNAMASSQSTLDSYTSRQQILHIFSNTELQSSSVQHPGVLSTNNLPAANYAGATPNVDLLKPNKLAVQQQRTTMWSNVNTTPSMKEPNMHSGATQVEDVLQTTLDVLKSLDSQYFVCEENDNI